MNGRSLRILGLDAALGSGSVALLDGDTVLAEANEAADQGQSETLAPMIARVLHAAGMTAPALDAVSVTIGPGSFTGLRASLALAHGLAAAAGVLLIGVTVAEALAQPLRLGRRALWVAIDNRRGRVFLDRGAGAEAVSLAALPRPEQPVALAGDAAVLVAATLAAAGFDVMLTDVRRPHARYVAAAGVARLAGGLPERAVLPLYVDPPEARMPAGGLRPRPA